VSHSAQDKAAAVSKRENNEGDLWSGNRLPKARLCCSPLLSSDGIRMVHVMNDELGGGGGGELWFFSKTPRDQISPESRKATCRIVSTLYSNSETLSSASAAFFPSPALHMISHVVRACTCASEEGWGLTGPTVCKEETSKLTCLSSTKDFFPEGLGTCVCG
jgi:hypothetical protein